MFRVPGVLLPEVICSSKGLLTLRMIVTQQEGSGWFNLTSGGPAENRYGDSVGGKYCTWWPDIMQRGRYQQNNLASLFTITGTAYNAGNGSTTFNLPGLS